MSPVLIAGTVIVNLALIAYGIGVFSEQRSHRVSLATLNWLRMGVIFDITATTCMIIGSSRGWFTVHGVLGFSSLAAMMLETALAWRHRATRGDERVPRWLHRYSRFAYGWWIAAYITGAVLVMTATRA